MQSVLLTDMMLFLAVVDNKSFTAAANHFGITKSVVSKRISRLEKHLGSQLLYRSTRKLSLSEVGQILYDHCSQIKSNLEAAELAVTARTTEPRGRLRVNCPSSFAYLHLVPVVAEFMKQYPEVNIELLPGEGYDDMVESGIDVAIRIGDLPDSSLVAKRLTLRKMRVCAAPSYIEKHGKPERPEDLVNHNCLTHHHSPTGNEWHFLDGKRQIRIPVKGNFSASNSQVIESAAVSGVGLAMLPGYMMTADLREGRLVQILEDYCDKDIAIYAVYQQTRHLAPKVRAFIDYLYKRFQDETYWDNKTRLPTAKAGERELA